MNTMRIAVRIFLLLTVGLAASGIWAQATQFTVSKNQVIEIPAHIDRKYRRDAARLALRLESEKDDYRFLSPQIPKSNTEAIYRALVQLFKSELAVQNLANCNVHTYPNPSIESFTLVFSNKVSWAAPLHQGINETLHPRINHLLQNYRLVIDKFVHWNERQDAITIRSREPINIAAVANEFYNLDGIEAIDVGVPKIQGNDISIKRMKNGWEVEYLLVFGEYLSGNGKQHKWLFHAYDNGTTRLLREWGDPLPDWMRCQIDDRTPLASF